MEKGNKRPLAYQLANSLPNDQLDEVSGGAGSFIKNMSYKRCFTLSGNGFRQRDAAYDVTADI